ncbi:MAG TPA: sulfatase-like hydrolase/transferase [Rhizomicrobium sp.]|nr:sulfatase-like hydrolase/transferase [Rhizomicrobium sp.]
MLTRRAAIAAATAAVSMPAFARGKKGVIRPNLFHVLTDDQTAGDIDLVPGALPNLRAFRASGMKFNRHFVPISLCAPSRVGIMTQMQPHNHGIISNDGAYQAYVAQYEANAVPARLRASGYYVGHIGKYMNDGGQSHPPTAGFDWWATINGNFERYTNLTINVNGTDVHYGPHDYAMDIYALYIGQFIESVPAGKPWALFFWPQCPHGPATPAPQDVGTIDPASIADPPGFNVNTIGGKQRPPLSDDECQAIRGMRAQRIECLKSFDRLLGSATVQGMLAQAVTFFSSDNGYMQGQKCIDDRKAVLYEPSTRLPLYVRGPGIASGSSFAGVTCNLDVTATILELAGASMVWPVDGRSMVSILQGAPPQDWNTATLLQTPDFKGDEAKGGDAKVGDGGQFGVAAYNFRLYQINRIYELYDMQNDPDQLVDIWNNPDYANVQADLLAALEALKPWQGASCQYSGRIHA